MVEILNKKIRDMQEILNVAILKQSIDNKNILAMSHELDLLIMEYMKLENEL